MELSPLHRLGPGEAPGAGALSAEVGWNHVEADWRHLLECGIGYGRRDPAGRLVATAVALPYGPFAWVSMVLVDAAWRGRGVATDLVGRVLADVERAGAIAGLDCRPELRPFYQRFGFREVYEVVRLRAERVALPPEPPDAIVRIASMRVDEIPEIAEYDSRSFGAGRAALLAHLFDRQPGRAFVARAGEWGAGYVMGRDGRGVTQIGPLVAEDDETAIALAAHALVGVEGPVVIDALAAQRSYVDWLARVGFTERRPYVRMLRERAEPVDQPVYMFSPAGLEFG
jgi:GNAT superfamily N-acetyltransferase